MPRNPTQTKQLEKRFAVTVRKEFRSLKGLIKKQLTGTSKVETVLLKEMDAEVFQSDPRKTRRFLEWLDNEETDLKNSLNPKQRRYIQESYGRGLKRSNAFLARNTDLSRDELRDVGRLIRLKKSSNALQILFTRNYQALSGITAEMDRQISRILTDEISKGSGAYKIARKLNEEIDSIGINRGTKMARTEVIHAFNQAAKDNYERHGVSKVEFMASLGPQTCPECLALDGQEFKLSEAPVPPLHPSCRCTLAPIQLK